LRSLLEEAGTAGNLTTDTHLAALAISHGAVLISCDNDFMRFKGLRWENPLGHLRR
jgi:predicted nucleic acid-binding protein